MGFLQQGDDAAVSSPAGVLLRRIALPAFVMQVCAKFQQQLDGAHFSMLGSENQRGATVGIHVLYRCAAPLEKSDNRVMAIGCRQCERRMGARRSMRTGALVKQVFDQIGMAIHRGVPQC